MVRRRSTKSAAATGSIRSSARTVDRYVQEFERLLASVGQDEASEAVAKTYLLSDTGKVYTLLAHAAGKLG